MVDVYCLSGTSVDVQNACNLVIVGGGGNVYVPEGDWAWQELSGGTVKINLSSLPDGAWLNIIGSNSWDYALTVYGDSKLMPKTIFRSSSDAAGTGMFYVTGTQNKHIRFSGLSLLGHVSEPLLHNYATWAIFLKQVDVFRVDHCFIDSFTDEGIGTWASKGVIDHCTHDDSFAEHQSVPHNEVPDGYGIAVFGNSQFGGVWADINNLLGKWDTGLDYTYGPVYIEDCNFRMCRHAVASAQHAWYVTRHCYYGVSRSDGMPMVDVHGMGPGGRGLEAYNNELTGGSPAFGIRGGGGVITNNNVHDTNYFAMLIRESPDTYMDMADLWMWGNTVLNSNMFSFPATPAPVEGVNFFTTARPSYTPYQYPHPLASGITPPPPTNETTPYTSVLAQGSYKITMPTQVQAGIDLYNFKQWEDGSTNPVRQVILNQNMSLTATYVVQTITINIVAGSNGTVTPSGTQILTVGQLFSVTATPNMGYYFDHWDLSGVNKGSTNPLNGTVTADLDGKILTALFVAIPPRQVTVTLAVIGNGVTDLAPGPHQFNIGDTVTIIATPDQGFKLKNWTLNGTTYTDNPLHLPIVQGMNGKTLTVNFELMTVTGGFPMWVIGIVLLGLGVGTVYALKGGKK